MSSSDEIELSADYDEDNDPLVGFFDGPSDLSEQVIHWRNERFYRQTVETLWAAFDRFDFEAVAPLLHDEFVCEWPQSGEVIHGRDNYIAVNKHYPGKWRCIIQQIVTERNTVVTETEVRDGEQVFTAVSFFTLKDDKIVHLREYWPDPMEAQAWRAQWIEKT